ncbi:RNA polymerase sigma factor [Paenibacillus alkalitolerans]|uniref:RNA polymerase sigma factor n=1 Tax=Paenibacillus alkalitolerans TaxID=2799335 RepID=UPI0018F3AC11|nr:RNA polymerase sigma factor [Paenibacillus alkalitolerans]
MRLHISETANALKESRGAAERPDRDQTLVERAQQGDTEAFGELIEQHRNKARDWAERMTGDPHMADDVVQDALIRAFLHLGTLTDTSRFLPWFHRIVRNQANMRLRRGGPHRKEKPFASMGRSADTDRSRVDWEDLDSILYHLSRTAADAAAKDQDPAESLLRKEMYETIHALLHCLSPKERGIFKAYFFQQLNPEEIAAMYRMTTGSIYTYIHRSRQKLRKEHIRVSLGLLPEKRGGGVLAGNKVLQLPEWPPQLSVNTTFGDSVGRILAMLGDRRDTAELMCVSTLAFRMKISDRTTFADGIYIFDWRRRLQAFMEELGYKISVLAGQLADSPVPLLGAVERFPVVLPIEEAVLPFIRKYIDAGKPVLYFDTLATKPYVHEWAIIFGYDDERRIVHLTDQMLPEGKTLSYDDVADNPVRFLAGIDGCSARPPGEAALRTQAERTIRFAVEYARRGCDYRPSTVYLRYTSGLAAYDRWIGHLRSGHTVPNRYGMGQLSAVYAETKRYASQYLRGVTLEGEAMRLTLLASEAYEQAADAMEKLSGVVPFIRTSEVLAPDMRDTSAAYLETAKEFETAAIGYLEKAITFMREGK